MERHLEVEEVIDSIHRLTTDTNAYYDHLMAGTLETYYTELLTTIVTDMMVLPLERGFAGLEPLSDPREVQKAFTKMITYVATLFDKSDGDVERDLVTLMKDYPVDDVRISQFLRLKNKLN